MRNFLSSGGRFDSGVRPANVWLLRSKVLSRTLLEFVLARYPAGRGYRSRGEVNDLIKGPFGEVSPSMSRMVICPDASTAQNYIAAPLPSTRSGGSTVWRYAADG